MRCVLIDTSGAVVDLVPQPSDVTSCTLVLVSPTEVNSSPFVMDLADAAAIGGAVMLLWAVAFGIRQVLDFLRSS